MQTVPTQRLGAALILVCLVITGCGVRRALGQHGDPTPPAHSAAYEGGIELTDPRDGVWLTVPAGTRQPTDPKLIADAVTGVQDSGPPPADLKLLALKDNPHSYNQSSVELYVDPTDSDIDTLIADYPQLESSLRSRGGYNFRQQTVTVDGSEVERVDYLMKFDAEPRQLTRLLIVHNGKLDIVLIGTDGRSPEPALADGIVASVVLG